MSDTLDQGLPRGHPAALHLIDPHDRAVAAGERFAARSAHAGWPGGWLARLVTVTGLEPEVAEGPLVRLGHGRPVDARWWLRARPVHLQADLDRVHLHPAALADLSMAESAALAATLADHLAVDDVEVECLAPQEWSIGLPRAWDVRAPAPETCAGADLDAALPVGADATRARRLLTEAQMLFHGHAVNATRAASGRAPANGLWVWGGGAARVLAGPRPAGVQATDPVLRGLARAVARDPEAVLSPGAGWREVDADFGPAALTPLFAALRRGALSELWWHGAARSRRMDRLAAWALWRA